MSRSPRSRVTQKAVALEANVSQTLVSLVLSGASIDVAEKTRQQILDAAKKLGYSIRKKPSTAVRSKALAYIRPVNNRGEHTEEWIYKGYDDFYDQMQNLLLEEALGHGYSLIVRPDDGAHSLTQWLTEWDVDGVIWHGASDLAEWIGKRYPMVQLHRQQVIDADAVMLNQSEITILSMQHLLKQGHRRILFAAGPPPDVFIRRARYKAYLEFIEEHNLPLWEECLDQEALDYFKGGATTLHLHAVQLARMIEEKVPGRPTAVVVGDHGAYYFMQYFQRRGIRVPEDISVVGIDNIAPDVFSYPKLTTIDNCRTEVARQVVELLVERIKSPERPHRKIYVTPKLIERESVAQLTPSASPNFHAQESINAISL